MTEKREAYVQELKTKMDEWGAEIDKIETIAEQVEADSRMRFHKQLEELRKKHKEVEDKIVELQSACGGGWDDLRQGLENSWEILKTSFTEAKSEFERGYREGREDT